MPESIRGSVKEGMATGWIELVVRAEGPVQDPISNFLAEQGSTGMVCGDRSLRAFFPAAEDRAGLKRRVRSYLRGLREVFPGHPAVRTRWRAVARENWRDAWRARFRPQQIGRRLLVTPPWIPPPETDRRVVFIEPAMAFGAGTHETTRCCLEFIDELCAGAAPAKALDVGTGSGILAIALARLGVREVLGLDNDPAALEAARANIERNGVGDAVTLSGAPVGQVRRRFPLVAANIVLGTLVGMAGSLTRCVAARGRLILSGLLRRHVPEALHRFPGLRLERRKDRGEWSTLLLRKEP